ncbi:unnamed protein product [Parnassius apollo]|uniref:(apollo) hypothetical protein n=1 Tax=Parnassius apollo TaxID=110799 RepID=A0A8S3YDZ9_PARAO|nr:unnamed protein product [Parnassius apollo]
MKITFSFLSCVLTYSGTKAPEIFKAFHNVLFDAEGKPTPELQHILDSRINLSSLSTIISKAGAKVPEAFKKLHDILFDAEGNLTPELQHAFDSGIRITSIFRVLVQSGINHARVFKAFHDVLFNDTGKPTPELQHILNSKISFSSISSALSGSGVRIAEAFKKFHDVLFNDRGKPTLELQRILDSKISSRALLNVLAKAGANAAQAFKKLHDVLFHAEGIPTPELQHILNSELTLANFFSIVANAGTNAAEAFKTNISSSSNILLVLSKISRSVGEKAEANFLVRAIGKVLDKLQYIHQCSDQDLPSEISSTIGRDGLVEASKSRYLVTDNILIDKDQSEKYTLTQFKEKLKKEGKVKYEEGIENYVRYNHGAPDFNYEFNIEKNHSKIMIAKVAYLVDRTVYGVFLATNESIAPKTFLGTYVGTGMEDNKEMNQHVLEHDSTVSIVSEKGRNWASYMNHVSTGNSNVRYNYESPAQRYNRAKDFYYDYVIDLDKEITRDLGYRGSKHFVVTKLFKQIYDKHNSQEEYASSRAVLSLEGLDVPIYVVTFRDKKWSFDRYDRQQQITLLMFACYLGQEDTIKLLLEKKDDVTHEQLLYCVPTDGHRLSCIKRPKPGNINGEFGVIIPRKTVMELLKILDECNEINVKLSDIKIKFTCGEYILISKLIDGTFPNYKPVIPASQDKHMITESKKLSDVIDRVSVIVSDKVKSIKFSLQEKLLTLHSNSQECNDATESIEVDYNEAPIEIGFNSRYLLDVLSCIKNKYKFSLADEERNNDKQKALDNAISQIEKAFDKGAIMKLKQNPVEKIDTISTGSIALDSALGVVGLPKGRIIEIFGPESSDTGEQALHIVEYLVCSGAVDVIVIDSVAALTPRAEIEGDMGDQHMGLQARLGLRKLTSVVSKVNCILIFINQIRMKIGVVYGNPETTTGGNALKFYTSVRLDIRKVGVIKEKENIIGNETRVKVVKNKVAPPFREAKFDIMYNEGISKLGEIIDMGAKLGVLEKAGAYYSYNNTRLGQGRENVKTYLKTNKEVANEIEMKIRDLLRNHGNSIIIDEDSEQLLEESVF